MGKEPVQPDHWKPIGDPQMRYQMFSAYFDPRLEIVGKIVWFEVFFGAEILEHHSFQRVFLRATEGFQLVASEFSRFYL